MEREENPLFKMGLGRQLLGLASRDPQLLLDLVRRHKNGLALTLHPDKNRGRGTASEYAEITGPFDTWDGLTEEEQMAAVEQFLAPIESPISDAMRFLGGLQAETTDDEVSIVRRMLSEVSTELHQARQLVEQKEREIGAAETRMALFNPERDLEVSGLVQGLRTALLNVRETGGNVNRLNAYTFFGRTKFVTGQVKRLINPEPADLTLAKTGDDNEGVIAKFVGRRSGKAKAKKAEPPRPASEYTMVRVFKAVSTMMYFVRSDTGIMAIAISREAPEGKHWNNEAEAVNSLTARVMTLRRRALKGDFCRVPKDLGATTWKFLGHIVGQLDPLIKARNDCLSPDGNTISIATACERLGRDLSRVISFPTQPTGGKKAPMTLLVVEPIFPSRVRPTGDDIDVLYCYRQIAVQAGAFDPFYIPPHAS